jgi:glycosyltransferase involved in cell wall biosynthesis
MRILMIHPHDLFDPHEPWTIRIESIAREFLKMKHEVKVIHFIRETALEKYTIHPYGFEVISLKRRGGLRFFKRNFCEIVREIKWADIVHFQKCFHYVSIPALFGAFYEDKPIHYDWDDLEEAIYVASAHPPNKIIHFFLRTFEALLPRLVDTVSVASAELKRKVQALGVPDDRIFDAPVGADLHSFGKRISGVTIRDRFKPKGKLVLYLGQLNGAQYTELFIEAVRDLKKEYPNTLYLIVGSGTKFKELRAYAEKLGVLDLIRFVGAIRHDAVPSYLAAADITVACFEDNSITRCKSPLKVVEYLAAGKAIVASAVGEVTTMLNECGVLVAPGSSAALADGIRNLLKADEPELKTLGERARLKAETVYNWPRVAKNIECAYNVAFGARGIQGECLLAPHTKEQCYAEKITKS